jgi:hypothetical protein
LIIKETDESLWKKGMGMAKLITHHSSSSDPSSSGSIKPTEISRPAALLADQNYFYFYFYLFIKFRVKTLNPKPTPRPVPKSQILT